MKAREFDAKDEVTEPDPGSNPSDDKGAAVLEEQCYENADSQRPAITPRDASRSRRQDAW